MFSKTIIFVSLVSLRSQNCSDLRAFLGVKSSSRILFCVKELTFRNSDQPADADDDDNANANDADEDDDNADDDATGMGKMMRW